MGRRSKRDRAGLAVSGAVVAAADRAGELGQRAREGAGPLYDRVVDSAGELAVAAAPVVGSAVETVSGVLEDALERGGAAWDALRGDRVGPPVAVRRWPWALGAAVLGAAAGAVAAAVVRKVAPPDAPGAQEPHELRAVVDTTDGPAPAGAGVVPPREDQERPDGAPTASPPVGTTTFEL